MFLSQEELHMLTGYKPNQYKRQAKYLSDHGYKFDKDVYGRPRVLVSHIETELGSSQGKKRKTFEPDFSKFDNRKTA